MKIQIKYATLNQNKAKMLYLFYPNGKWDEDKLDLREAALKYPRTKYQWVKLK